ncbi:rhomboid family intramembrane serine protease [candidate division KSB1 bacterium]|nr:rhomboid family intramembrane serine protease [candidate division KSB1 bacterium]
MIPIRDSHVKMKTTPIFTVLLILGNIAVFVYQFLLGPDVEPFLYKFGAIPWEISHFQDLPGLEFTHQSPMPNFLTLFTAMFLHGGILHLAGNMLYLWIFGDNVEALTGHLRFPVFYLTCGLVAAMTHVVLDPGSHIPMIGASGAVSGILGAYFIRFPKAKVHMLVFFPFVIFRTFQIPAVVVLGIWFILQVLNGLGSLGYPGAGGVAWFAHIGGFIAGMILIFFFQKKGKKRAEARWI